MIVTRLNTELSREERENHALRRRDARLTVNNQQLKLMFLKEKVGFQAPPPPSPRLNPSSPSLGLTDYSQVDMFGLRYSSVNFAAEQNPG